MNLDKLDESEKFIFCWQYRMLGGFKEALLRAIMIADDTNLEKLRVGFPEEVEGFINYSQKIGWWTKVELKVGK